MPMFFLRIVGSVALNLFAEEYHVVVDERGNFLKMCRVQSVLCIGAMSLLLGCMISCVDQN